MVSPLMAVHLKGTLGFAIPGVFLDIKEEQGREDEVFQASKNN